MLKCMIEKEAKKQVRFNLSPSSLNVYYKSPLLFYLQYIAKVPDDTPVPVCYGLSGGLVHECLEKYAKQELDADETYLHFVSKWQRLGLDESKDLKDQTLNQTEYLKALIKGIEVINSYNNHVCEEMISFNFKEDENFKIGIKGIIDLQAIEDNGNYIVVDYKTSNNVNEGKEFERQALFYNLLLHKKKGEIPSKTSFHYLKLDKVKHYIITKEDLEAFEEELHAVAEEILSYGLDISKYPIGDIDDVFNSKKKACLMEIERRNMTDVLSNIG